MSNVEVIEIQDDNDNEIIWAEDSKKRSGKNGRRPKRKKSRDIPKTSTTASYQTALFGAPIKKPPSKTGRKKTEKSGPRRNSDSEMSDDDVPAAPARKRLRNIAPPRDLPPIELSDDSEDGTCGYYRTIFNREEFQKQLKKQKRKMPPEAKIVPPDSSESDSTNQSAASNDEIFEISSEDEITARVLRPKKKVKKKKKSKVSLE